LIEIYGLFDPDTGELRYVGKAKNSQKRLKCHLFERKLTRPVNRWVKSLVDQGKCPVLKVLETVLDEEWESAERQLIAHYRKTCNLLNLADGGAGPSQTKEQRRKAAKTCNEALKGKSPEERRFIKAKQDMARLYTKFKKEGDKTGDYFHAYQMRFIMRLYYAADPNGHASWANI